MADMLKQISCSPECGFMVRSHDEKEVMDMATDHVKTQHPETTPMPTPEDMKAKMTEVPEM